MKVFSYFYHKTINWSAHNHAPYYLAGVSFAESSFFPIPPDVMLVSMGLAKPHFSWRFAFIATLFSVIGGIFGYLIGYFAMSFLKPYILASSYKLSYLKIVDWFKDGGVGMVVLAGFSPFPYKLFTITAGAMQLSLLPFVIGSLIGRGGRFYLVSTLMYYAGERIEKKLRRYIDVLGFAFLAIFALVYVYFHWIK